MVAALGLLSLLELVAAACGALLSFLQVGKWVFGEKIQVQKCPIKWLKALSWSLPRGGSLGPAFIARVGSSSLWCTAFINFLPRDMHCITWCTAYECFLPLHHMTPYRIAASGFEPLCGKLQ